MMAIGGGAAADRRDDELDMLLRCIRVGSQVAVLGGDVFVPLFLDRDRGEVAADLLEEGIAAGVTILREIDEQGEVGKVHVEHRGERLLLLVDGEQIVGAKQNRVFNASFLVAPGAAVELPVSCVERGRWRDESRLFSGSDTTLTGAARSRKLSRVTHSIMSGAGYDAQQDQVWRDVDRYLQHSRVVSRTSALEDAIASKRDDTRAKLGALRPLDGQAGIALVRGGRLLLMDLFGSCSLYARGYQKIAAGMVADADVDTSPCDNAHDVVTRALISVAGLSLHQREAPGCGTTLHGQADGLVVGAVTYQGHVFHALVAAA